MCNQTAGALAATLGYTQRVPTQELPFDSSGQPGFFNGKNYISQDVGSGDGMGSHNGRVWKLFSKSGDRKGPWNANLTVQIRK